ncbi:hypothetical protein D3C86_2156880 [compost metagenome]
MTICTLSCSTSLRAARSAESGLASVAAMMNSISLPAILLFACLAASCRPRTPSSPPEVSAPESVAITPILSFSCA